MLVKLTDPAGVLLEAGCGDAGVFKGVFVRYLRYLLDESGASLAPDQLARYEGFLRTQADSVWSNAQDAEGAFGTWWGGRSMFQSSAVEQQISAIEAFTAARRPAPSHGAALSANAVTPPAPAPGPFVLPLLPAGQPRPCIAAVSVAAGPGSCSGAGEVVRDRCVCDERSTGRACEKAMSWSQYYINRRVTMMSATGRFCSSGGQHAPRPTMQHTGDQEHFTVASCGPGIAVLDALGFFLVINTTDATADVADVVMIPPSSVNCGRDTNASFAAIDVDRPARPGDPRAAAASGAGGGGPAGMAWLGTRPNGTVLLQSSITAGANGSHWYLSTAARAAGVEMLVAKRWAGEEAPGSRFKVTLAQHCQGFA